MTGYCGGINSILIWVGLCSPHHGECEHNQDTTNRPEEKYFGLINSTPSECLTLRYWNGPNRCKPAKSHLQEAASSCTPNVCKVVPPPFQNEKSAQRGSFGTDILRTSRAHSRGYPGPKLRSGRSISWTKKNKHFGADIHDPKARTSTTLRGFQKLRSEKLWAEFSLPIHCKDFPLP